MSTTPSPTVARTTTLPIERTTAAGQGAGSQRGGSRLSWGAVFAGLAMATALQIVLTMFGLAFGLGVYNPGGEKALGIGTGIWAIISLLIALFFGGTTTGWLAGRLTPTDGFLHGVLLWALSTLLTIHLLSRGLGAVVGGALGAVGNVVGTATSAVASGAASAVGSGASAAAGALTSPSNDSTIRAQITESLRQSGDPALRPDSLAATAKQAGAIATNGPADNSAAASDIVDLVKNKAKTIDRSDIVNIIAARTGRSRADAEQIADRVTQAATSARNSLSQTAANVEQTVREKAPQVAESAASGASTGIWLALLGMGLSLAAAVFGTQRTAAE